MLILSILIQSIFTRVVTVMGKQLSFSELEGLNHDLKAVLAGEGFVKPTPVQVGASHRALAAVWPLLKAHP